MRNLIVLRALRKSFFLECFYNNLLYTFILPPNSSISFILGSNFSPVHIVRSMRFLPVDLQAFHPF